MAGSEAGHGEFGDYVRAKMRVLTFALFAGGIKSPADAVRGYSCSGEGYEMNWRAVRRNWAFIGGLIFGLFFLVAGLIGMIGPQSIIRQVQSEVWIGVGAIFLALVLVNGWKRERNPPPTSN